MKLIQAHSDRVVLEVSVQDLMNIEGALLNYHRDQQMNQTPFGVRIEDLTGAVRQAQNAAWEQDARARGLTVEGDEPVVGGAF